MWRHASYYPSKMIHPNYSPQWMLRQTCRAFFLGLRANLKQIAKRINETKCETHIAKTLDTKSAGRLIEKVEQNLTTHFYQKGPKQICKVMDPEFTDREQLRINLITIQKAIDHNVQVSFRFNGYTYRKKLEPVRDRPDTVSPYYIVVGGGRYYLLACKEIVLKGKTVRNMSIWRIDLMTDITIPEENDKGLPRIPKKDVDNLPMEWTEDFQLKYKRCIIAKITKAN